MFFKDESKYGVSVVDLYEFVQHADNILPRLKRAGEGEVVEGESENDNNNNNIKDVSITSLIKKHRICATAAIDSEANNNIITERNNNSNHDSSNVVESLIMAPGDSNLNDVEEGLHSHQLAVCGRETMRWLFASISSSLGHMASMLKS